MGVMDSTIGSPKSRLAQSQKASECTIQLHCFQNFVGKSKYCIKTCHIACVSVLVFMFSSFSYSSKSFQIPSQCMLQLYIVFIYFSAVPNCLRYLYTFRAHALKTLFSSIPLQFQIVSDTTRMHALETLFSRGGAWLRVWQGVGQGVMDGTLVGGGGHEIGLGQGHLVVCYIIQIRNDQKRQHD